MSADVSDQKSPASNENSLKRKTLEEGGTESVAVKVSRGDTSEDTIVMPPADKATPAKPVRLCLGSQKPKIDASIKVKPTCSEVRKVFDDDEEIKEVMPPEARQRMRNKGRETPTSSGPNSFGKGRHGFLDRRAMLDRETRALMEAVSADADQNK